MTGLIESVALQLRVAKRLAPRRDGSFSERLGRLDDRLVFVVGSPRSGTTFLAAAIGSLRGFVDLGEVAPLKAAAPELAALSPEDAAGRLRRMLAVSRRVGLVGAVRGVEQTPEVAHLVEAVALAYPEARVVHVVRDGRDVACSLLDKGWLGSGKVGADDAGIAYGAYPRFWVVPDRRAEFTAASDATRAAWAWRSYVSAARRASSRALEVRYERMTSQPAAVADELAHHLGAHAAPLASALGKAHSASVGRFRRELSGEQLADVVAEAGDLLRDLGYLD